MSEGGVAAGSKPVGKVCALGFVGGVCACPAGVTPCPGVVEGPRTPCTPEVRGRLDGGISAAPGGGEDVPVGGEDVPPL